MTVAVLPIPRRVAVVGAGVVGASAAARIAELGIEVVLFSADPAGATPVSRASFAWVNAHGKRPEPYRRLNEDGRRVHAARSAAHESAWFVHTGAEVDGAVHPDDGYVDADAFLTAQLADFHAAGGTLRVDTPVDALDDVRELVGRVDLILVAAGAATSRLLGDLAGPRLSTSAGDDGFLTRIDVGEHPVERIVSAGGLQVRPDGPWRIAAQSLTIEAELRRTGTTASVATVWAPLRAEIESALGWRIPEDAMVRVDHAIRPHAVGGLPCIGRVAQDVYVAVTHSGMTLAPLLAESIARDLQGDPDPRLAPFRP